MRSLRRTLAATMAIAVGQYAALAGFIWAIKHAEDAPLASVALT